MNRGCSGAFVLLIVGCAAMSQQNRPAWTGPDDPFARLDLYVAHEDAQNRRGELESLPDSVSKLDLKAPGKARREYEKGLELLIRKNYASAFEHLTRSISIYPKFVAAHNALGSAYMDEGENEHAREEFTQAVVLDDHLSNSYLNLGRSELALKRYPAAQESIQRASSIEPLNLQILTALTYAQFLNQDYGAAIATAHQVHARKHDRAAMVHYFAAAALEEQNNLQESQRELETLLKEDPNSPSAALARQMMAQIQERENQPVPSVKISFVPSPGEVPLAPGEMAPRDRKLLQEFQEQNQVAEAECETCDALRSPIVVAADVSPGASAGVQPFSSNHSGWTLHSTVDEVPVFFAATDHGKSITDLSEREIRIRDDGSPPAAITGFRNESRLPLRVGLLVDTSGSITTRFSFERDAASEFLQQVIIGKNDLGFVVGFANSIRLVQDFTDDKKQISHGLDQLAPAGGTAIWDAVAFAADKLASRRETHPVAKILVVISDGDDNSSSATLKEAIESAERGELTIYAVSTREAGEENDLASVGNRALRTLAQRTGGTVFYPGSAGSLKRGLAEVQEVIRSRYLVSYKPALFRHDGRYRTIDITAEKSGRKLRVYARKGYYARVNSTAAGSF